MADDPDRMLRREREGLIPIHPGILDGSLTTNPLSIDNMEGLIYRTGPFDLFDTTAMNTEQSNGKDNVIRLDDLPQIGTHDKRHKHNNQPTRTGRDSGSN